ncbi:MAG: DUF11 domain-containing protein [Rhodanobacter sp.]
MPPVKLRMFAALILLGGVLPVAWSQTKPDCSPKMLQHYIRELRRTPPVTGCQASLVAGYVGKYGYQVKPQDVQSPRPSGEVVKQYPDGNEPLPSTKTVLLWISDGSQPQPPKSGGQGEAAPKKGTPTSAAVTVSNTLLGAGPFQRGEKVKFRIVTENRGPATAGGITLYFEQTNLKIAPVPAWCNQAECQLVDLKPGMNSTVDVDAVILAEGQFRLAVTARHATTDRKSADVTSVAGGIVPPSKPQPPPIQPHLSVTTALGSKGPYHAGDNAEFVVVVRNGGTAAATNVQITGDFSNLHGIHVEGGCKQLPCTLDGIGPGSGIKLVIRAAIDGEGEFVSKVTATSTQSDPKSASATGLAARREPPLQRADLSVTNELVSHDTYRAGDSAEFSVSVHNDGPATATSVSVVGDFSNLELIGVDGDCKQLPCMLDSIQAGAGIKFVMRAAIERAGDFTAKVTATSAQTDPNLINNSADVANRAEPSLPPEPRWQQWVRHNSTTWIAVLSALVLAAGAAFARRRWWRNRVKAKVDLERAGATRMSTPLPMPVPAVSLSVHLEPGVAGPVGKTPIVKEEVYRD